MFKFLDMFRQRGEPQESAPSAAFQKKYNYFKNILAGNSYALELITELEQLCYGVKPFTLDQVIDKAEKLQWEVYDIAEDLNALSGGGYGALLEAVERIGVGVLRDLVKKSQLQQTQLTITLQNLSQEHVAAVGGKAANLGEIGNRAHLPVPGGFAVTAYACQRFLNENKIYEQATSLFKGLDIEDTAALDEQCERMQNMVRNAPLPEALAGCLNAEVQNLRRRFGPKIRLAVRSSATSEDSEASFAGQHSSVLGVKPEDIGEAYKEVVASTFSPRAVYYRRSRGYPDEAVIMSALVLTMVDATASGVMYTRDPNDMRRNVLLLNAVFGLGLGAVDGSADTDYYEVDKRSRAVLTAVAANKPRKLALAGDGESQGEIKDGLVEVPVDPSLSATLALNEQEILALAEYGLALEEHYGTPLDIEWALDHNRHPVLLQARPLNIDLSAATAEASADANAAVDALIASGGVELLLRGGVTASRGKACGLSYVLVSDHNLQGVPEDCILITRQTSPRLVPILRRVQAIVTDVGSVTGHMASVAREFGVPTLVGLSDATLLIPHGEEITVDATNRAIFKGRVEQILERRKPVNPMKGSPTYTASHAALKKIAILNLVDPEKENFSPEGCQTLHDVIRFAHEMSMREMFSISDDLELQEKGAVRVVAPLPMKMYAIDLGGGLAIPAGQRRAEISDVLSTPFKALLAGMTHPDVSWVGGVAMDWRGFASIVAQSTMRPEGFEDERMGGPNYVVASKDYLNFNSRLGYHFAVVDAFCGDEVNDNYITFSFKGGAADIGRRNRRAELIARILKRLGFKTEVKGDLTRAAIKKYDCAELCGKLDMVGRLLGAMRLLDMVLADHGQIDWYVEQFFQGNYRFLNDKDKA
jgi:pyruvate,water dikinase